MQAINCIEKSRNNKTRPVQALCIDKQCTLNRSLCTSCIQNHKHQQVNKSDYISHTMIDIPYLLELLRNETIKRSQQFNALKDETMTQFHQIKNSIIQQLNNIENQLTQRLNQIQSKDVVESLYQDLTTAPQQLLTTDSLNQIGQKLSELMEEKVDGEKEIFSFKKLNFELFKDEIKIQPIIHKLTLARQLTEYEVPNKESTSLIHYAMQQQISKQSEMILTLSQFKNNESSKNYEVNIWNAQEIAKSYKSPEYEIEFAIPDIASQNQEKIKLEIQKKKPKIEQIIQQIGINSSYLDTSNINFQLTQNLEGHSGYIIAVAISYDEKYIASGGRNDSKILQDSNYEVFLWDLKTKKILKKYKGPQYVYSLSFSKNNTKLAAAGQYNPYDIYIYDIGDLSKNDPIQMLKGHSSAIYRTIFTNSSKYLISSSNDKTVRVWDLDGNQQISQNQCANHVYGLCLSENEELIGCCCYGGLAYLLDSKQLNSLTEKVIWQAHKSGSDCIEFIKSSTMIITSSTTEIRFWRVDDLLKNQKQCIQEIQSSENNISLWNIKAIPVSDPKVIIASQGKIKIWEMEPTQMKQTIEIPGGIDSYGTLFAITSDFKTIIAAANDKQMKIYQKVLI